MMTVANACKPKMCLPDLDGQSDFDNLSHGKNLKQPFFFRYFENRNQAAESQDYRKLSSQLRHLYREGSVLFINPRAYFILL